MVVNYFVSRYADVTWYIHEFNYFDKNFNFNDIYNMFRPINFLTVLTRS